ncbi:MAG: alpha/beta fold hydrolase, partial [Burkholderiales bacterium]|nr:alpha/beta fold hydrolase [Burkholderiales bacterium]
GAAPRGVDTGLFDLRIGPDVSALLGNGLGGGSLINAGVMKRVPADLFDARWPAAIRDATLVPYYARAEAMLQPAGVPPADECAKLAVLDGLADVAGLPPAERCPVTVNWAGAEVPTPGGVALQPCTLCGDCMTGCNQGAKGSLDTNYLAYAKARRVEMYCGVSVASIERDPGDSHWIVHWHCTERADRPAGGEAFKLRARRVVLAAGTLGSTEILLRSKALGLGLSPQLGAGFSTNGDGLVAGMRHPTPVHAVADPESDPADAQARRVGPTITGLVQVPADACGPAFAIEESSVPAALRDAFGEVTALLSWGVGEPEGYLVSASAIEHLSLFALMGDDGAAGRLRLPAAPAGATPAVEGGLKIDWAGAGDLPLYRRGAEWVSKHLASPAKAANTSLLRTAFTAHALGGCCMGEDFDHAVVDDCGRVYAHATFTHPGLAVLDGSIVPCALGINPALTITALAERAMPALMADWGLRADTAAPVDPLLPRPMRRRLELPAADAVWALGERMQGPCNLPGGPYWAQLEIEFEAVPGLRKALSLATRVLGVRRAVLRLQVASAKADEFTDLSATPVCCVAELAGVVRLFTPLGGTGDEVCLALDYQLSVQAVDGAGPLQPGQRVDGRKLYGADPQRPDLSAWRQLSEMDVRIGGQPVGRWALDIGDLAQRRDPLVRLRSLSSMPDALGDLSGMGLYLLRQRLVALFNESARSSDPRADHLGERWPGAIGGTAPAITWSPQGARLARYPAPASPKSDLPPVLLIHGLGASGSTFTHASIPTPLAASLLAQGREVWVLDLRSSIGNEAGRHSPASLDWTVDSVAKVDIPWGVQKVYESNGGQPIDVLAHCMGAVMFCMAALRGNGLIDMTDPHKPRSRVRSLVLSQVGPLVRLSPLNRLRGYILGWLQQFLRIDEVDTCPDFASRVLPDGTVQWRRRPPSTARRAVDALVSTFPYPDSV